jgi:hypothetical protein
MTAQTRWLGVNVTTGVWLCNFSRFVSAKGKTFPPYAIGGGNMNPAYFDFEQVHG